MVSAMAEVLEKGYSYSELEGACSLSWAAE